MLDRVADAGAAAGELTFPQITQDAQPVAAWRAMPPMLSLPRTLARAEPVLIRHAAPQGRTLPPVVRPTVASFALFSPAPRRRGRGSVDAPVLDEPVDPSTPNDPTPPGDPTVPNDPTPPGAGGLPGGSGTPVPEPTGLALMGGALAMLATRRARR